MGAYALLFVTLFFSSALGLEKCSQSSGCSCRGTCRSQATSCFGVELKNVSSNHLFNLGGKQHNNEDFLRAWQRVLSHVPQCWPKLQALLCVVAWPPCTMTGNGGIITRPAYEMCRLTIKSCPILTELFQEVPDFLNCSRYKKQTDCKSNLTRVQLNYHKFLPNNISCRQPLVKTGYKKNWFSKIEECGLNCKTPLFTPYEYRMARTIIPCLALICLFVNLFVCVTFLLDWRSWSAYPRIIIFYIHCCFLFGCLGWLVQFIPEIYTDIVCRRDGTRRRAEPQLNSGESATCSLVFALIYFTLMAVSSWFVIFLSTLCPKLEPHPTSVTSMTYEDVGEQNEKRPKKKRGTWAPSRLVCHLLAWILPSVLTIICLTVGEIDGDPLSGICFVGHFNIGARIGLFLVPLCASSAACVVLLIRILGLQWLLLSRAQDLNVEVVHCEGGQVSVAQLRRSRTFTGIFVTIVFSIFSYAVGIQMYIFINQTAWDSSVRRSILCDMRQELELSSAVSTFDVTYFSTLNSGLDNNGCQVDDRPNAGLLLLYVICYFAMNLCLSSLVYDHRIINNWKWLWSRVTSGCTRRLNTGYSASAPSSHSLVAPPNRRSPTAFSWWDLGFFPPHEVGFQNGTSRTGETGTGMDSEGSELISSSRLEVCSSMKHQSGSGGGGMIRQGYPHPAPHLDYRGIHRRSGSLSSARTTPTLMTGEENYGPSMKRSHRSSNRSDRRSSRRRSQRRHDRDIRRSMSDCSSASSAAVQWRGSWGSVQSYNSYNPQRGVLEERYANWRIQAALNWSSSMAPFYSHTGLPLNFPWQPPLAIPMTQGSGITTPGYWGCPQMHALWPIYMIPPHMTLSGHVQANGKHQGHTTPSSENHLLSQEETTTGQNMSCMGQAGDGNVFRTRTRGQCDSDEFDSEDEVESMNSDAFDSEDEVMSGSDHVDPERLSSDELEDEVCCAE